MRSRLHFAIPAFLAAFISHSAIPIEPAKYYFDCDVPPGHSSGWTRTIAATEVTVSGSVTLVELREHKQWLSAATVFISSADESQGAGLQAHVPRKAPDELQIDLVSNGPDRSERLGALARSAEPMPFWLQLLASGELRVSVANLSASTHLKNFRAQKVSLSCTTGQYKFKDVIVDEVHR